MRRAPIIFVLAALAATLLATVMLAPTARAAGSPIHVGTPIRLPGIFEIDSLACAHGDICEAVGENDDGHPVAVRVADGRSGRPMPITGGPKGFEVSYDVTCPRASFCVAIGGLTSDVGRGSPGGSVLALIINGVPHRAIALPGAGSFSGATFAGVSCASAAHCVALGENGTLPITRGVPGALSPYSGNVGNSGGIICPGGRCELLGAQPVSQTAIRAVLLPLEGLAFGAPRPIPGITGADYGACAVGRCELVGETAGDTEAAISLVRGRFGPPVRVSVYTDAVVCLSRTTCLVATPAGIHTPATLTPISQHAAGKPIPIPIAPAAAVTGCTAPGRCYIAGDDRLLPIDATPAGGRTLSVRAP